MGGLLLALSTFSSASADTALDLWAQGKYEEAIASGLADKSADGLSVAARAATTEMSLHAMPCLECVRRAEDLSRKALAAEPKAAVPSFCLAAALAYHGRMVGTINTKTAAIGSEARKTIEEALAAHPNDARLMSAMAIWNFEVVRVAGSMLSRIVYGATMDRGLALFDQAFRLSPNDTLMNFQYGMSLAAYDPDEYRSKIEAAWGRVVAARPQNSYDEEMKSRAVKLLALLKSGNKNALDETVKGYLWIPK
jgi:hypothetical protein